MTLHRRSGIAATLLLLAIAGVASAHHGTEAYDMGKQITLKGTIAQFEWSNPHGQVHLDVTDDKGNVVHYNFETQPPSILRHAGWDHDSLKPGDQVSVTFHPVKNGAPVGIIMSITLPNGDVLTPNEK